MTKEVMKNNITCYKHISTVLFQDKLFENMTSAFRNKG